MNKPRPLPALVLAECGDLECYGASDRAYCWTACRRCRYRLATAADHAEALGLSVGALSRAAIYANNDGLRTRKLVEEGCEDPLTRKWPGYCDQDEEAFYAAEERVREAEQAKADPNDRRQARDEWEAPEAENECGASCRAETSERHPNPTSTPEAH